jgi:hypothetical protein
MTGAIFIFYYINIGWLPGKFKIISSSQPCCPAHNPHTDCAGFKQIMASTTHLFL